MAKQIHKNQLLSERAIQSLFLSYTPRPDAIELNGCIIVGKDHLGKELVEGMPVTSKDRLTFDFYAIYWHLPGRGLEWLEDFNTIEEAEIEQKRVEKICGIISE